MFLHLSLSHSVHGGWTGIHHLGRHPRADSPLDRYSTLPRQTPPRHISPPPRWPLKRTVRILLTFSLFQDLHVFYAKLQYTGINVPRNSGVLPDSADSRISWQREISINYPEKIFSSECLITCVYVLPLLW